MTDEHSVSYWLDGLKAGDPADVQRLWDRYFERLVRLAGSKLPGHSRREIDEEDVALSAFHSFCKRIGRGQFPRLDGRHDLWRVLATITARKVVTTIRHQTRQKRGGGAVLGESALVGPDEASGEGMAQVLGREPTPDEAAALADDCERLLSRLDDPVMKSIALRRLEGHTSEEIAALVGISKRSVDRKLQLIRALWDREEA